MSLAYATLIDDESNDNYINKKKNKTQKRYGSNSNKVNSVLDQIHMKPSINDSEQLGTFNPPQMTQSAGVDKTDSNIQNTINQNNIEMFKTIGNVPQPTYRDGDNLDLNNINTNYGNNESNKEYYNKIMEAKSTPSPSMINKQYYDYNNIPNSTNLNVLSSTNDDVLIKKLNYMINLLEEQQDEKTNNITEEVILYSFLGIFIIFVVDSFSRVGKYVRR